ncbi:MAG: hypothetical protein AAB865_01555 [Patescibacteria group bacterium]
MPARTPASALDPYRHLLGQKPDHEIARQAGVSRTLVGEWRRGLGVEAYQGYKFGTLERPGGNKAMDGTFHGRRSKLDEFTELIGHRPDAEIAAQAGVTAENVRTYRRRRGIAAFWRDEGKTPSSPPAARVRTLTPKQVVAAPAPPPPEEVFAVTVTIDGETRVYGLLAHSLPDAILRAGPAIEMVCPKCRIKGVQRVGELLRN